MPVARLVVGVDVGSTAAKAVVLDGDSRAVLGVAVTPTGWNPRETGEAVLHAALREAGTGMDGVARVVGTGYGRISLPFLHRTVTEITCHARGAHHLAPETRTVLDVGGQDSKVVAVDERGNVRDFVMNDKCAAGTGRFYEAMARSFEMSLPEFSNLSLTARNVIPITAQCTVFAESEVITLVGEGKPMDEIAAGIQMAVAKRCFVMAKKAGATDAITLTGGCAKNAGLKQAIEHVLKLKVIDLKTDPQLMGALGAAEYARQKGMARA